MELAPLQQSALGGLAPAARTSLDAVRLDGARRAAERGDAEQTAREFETLFAVLLVRELRRSMPSGLFGESAGADVFEGWFDEHLGGALARGDALGIAGMVKAALGRAQAARDVAADGATGSGSTGAARAQGVAR